MDTVNIWKLVCRDSFLQSLYVRCIVETKMTRNSSRFTFTFRYWRTIAASAE